MRQRRLAGWLALLCMTAAAGCGSGGGETGPATDVATRVRSTSPATDQAIGARPTKKKKKKHKSPVLAGQLVIHAGAGGRGPDCVSDLSQLPSGFATSPAVWLSGMDGPTSVPLALDTALCLHGFSADKPVTVTVTVGSHGYRTTVSPSSSPLTVGRVEPPETLFDGHRLQVFDAGSGLLESHEWGFVPPSGVRDDIVTAGAVTTSAAQAGTSASHRQKVTVSGTSTPGQRWITGAKHHLAVFNFDQDEQVPVGLYHRSGPSEPFKLMRRIGSVTMPRSRIAVFTLPPSVTETGDRYCVSVPLDTLHDCPAP
ncbi:hypothetical protein AB0G87_01200 [Streptomyces asoensis]|uniref:hypothetical protein n=1 Tax=Streptomyces asoensis TaxID=249586 RepID=UPI0034073A4B